MDKKKTRKKINILIIDSLRIVVDKTVDIAIIPAEDGDIGVVSTHAPFLSVLREGDIRLQNDDQIEKIPVKSGIVEVLNDSVRVLIET